MSAKRSAPKGGRTTFIQRSRDVSPEAKAMFHNRTGRVKREFFDLSPSDEEAITDVVERHLDTVLGK